jgi:hypothetical protein
LFVRAQFEVALLLELQMTELMAQVDGLLRETGNVRTEFDEWVQASRNGIDAVEASHRASLAAAKAELAGKEAYVNEVGARAQTFSSTRKEHTAAVESERAALASLENTARALPAKTAALRSDKEAAAAAVAAERAERGGQRADMEHQLNELTRGVVMYKFLGLEFQRAEDDRLLIRFTNIDPEHWEREFCFRVSLGEDDNYHVDGCTPAVPQATLSALLDQLNAPNEVDPMEFPGFVIEMRRAFKAMV